MSEPFQARLSALAEHPLVGDARGVGMIGAIELVADKGRKTPFGAADGVGAHCMAQAQEAGLIVRALGDTVAICPPLVITEGQVHELFDKLERALAATLDFVHSHSLTG